MGCFSFICKKSNRAVLSSSFSGDAVHLFLLKNGKVIEHMFGNYDSYGRVFSSEKKKEDKSLTKFTSFEWNMEWPDVCELMFDDNKSNGIAAILEPFWKEGDPYPTERSKDDPNQGWGDNYELLNSKDTAIENWVDKPYHKIYT